MSHTEIYVIGKPEMEGIDRQKIKSAQQTLHKIYIHITALYI